MLFLGKYMCLKTLGVVKGIWKGRFARSVYKVSRNSQSSEIMRIMFFVICMQRS